jgi:hypothetical protein
MQVGRVAHGGAHMGVASAYHYPPGFYPIRGAQGGFARGSLVPEPIEPPASHAHPVCAPFAGQGSSHHLAQHRAAGQPLYGGSNAAASSSQASGAGADAQRSQAAPRQTPAQPDGGAGVTAAVPDEQPAASPAAEQPASTPQDPTPVQAAAE